MQALLNSIATMAIASDAQRIFHGRGGLYPGCEHLALDVYPPVYLLTSFEPLPDAALAQVHKALSERIAAGHPGVDPAPLNWVYQCRHAGHSETRLMAGSVPDGHTVSECGTRYRVHLLKGQNHGLFLDMAEGRSWVRAFVAARPRCKVLNLFAYTCAFSVVALKAGARHVLNVDMSAGALATGQHNHALNGISAGAGFLPHDIFKTWGKVGRAGPFDLIIIDPPSYQKGSFVATKDYARLLHRLPDLLDDGGQVLLCLNAPELDLRFLQDLMQQHAPQLQFVQRIANPVAFADATPERALKVLVYQSAD